jgi:hypothetical protein
LSDAVADMCRADEEAARRRRRLQERRESLERLDRWLEEVESMLERDRYTVPEALVGEIGDFVSRIDPKLRNSLMRNEDREAVAVLDVLFDAQEVVMPMAAPGPRINGVAARRPIRVADGSAPRRLPAPPRCSGPHAWRTS